MGYDKKAESYEQLFQDYENLKRQFDEAENISSSTINLLKKKNSTLEKKLDSLSNIIEISKYINMNLSNDYLISMINDMIIGILGVAYSSIYLREDDKLILKASNIDDSLNIYYEQYGDKIKNGETFIINCEDSPFCQRHGRVNIHSVIGVPVVLGKKYIGYIVVEHGLQDYFSDDHIKFITAIANQIAIALENSILYNKVKEASIKDSLLKIYNRGYFFELLKEKMENSPNKDFAIVMIDADNFKKANDIYGHQFGDEALIQIAEIIKNNIDEKDIVARYGGEEVIIYINDVSDRKKVFNKINNIRKKISENILYSDEKEVRITASFGISYYDEENRNIKDVLRMSDTMLYAAKHSGKNIVVSV